MKIIFLAVENEKRTARIIRNANRLALLQFLLDLRYSACISSFGRVRVDLKKPSEETKLWMDLSKFKVGKVYESGL